MFWNQGQSCSAGTRVYVEAPVYDDAVSAFVDRASAIVLGDGLDEATEMGPLVSLEQLERVEGYIAVGEREAKLAGRGSRPDDARLERGYFVPPTVFADVDNAMTIAREEIFGIPVRAGDDVVALANDNEYGLAAAVWTSDIKKAMLTARSLRAGVVWINDTQPAPTEMPWGGYKQSGVGRELGRDGVEDFLESKSVYVNLG